MGQISSEFQNLLPNFYLEMFHKESNSLISREIRELDHEKFLEIMNDLNILCKTSLVKDKKQIVFAIRKGSDETILWKSLVQIACLKIDCDTNEVEHCRPLTLEELLKIYFTLKCQSTAIGQSKVPQINYEGLLSDLNEETDLSPQCIICFERSQELSLPCTHSFCTQCIEEWNEEHDTCPICREKLASTDDTWVLSEKPNAEDISKELQLNLNELMEINDGSYLQS